MSDVEPIAQPKSQGRRIVVPCVVLLGFAGLILLAGAYAYHLARENAWLRNECLIALIVAGIGATSCLAGIIHLLNLPLAPRVGADGDPVPLPAWPVRLMLSELKRALLVLQLLTSALAVAAGVLLIFGFKIPGVAS